MITTTRVNRGLATIVAVVLLIAYFVVVGLSSNLEKSPTSDESIHLVAGYAYLKWGDFRINPEHPPLAKFLAALPLLAFKMDNTWLDREHRDLVQTDRLYAWYLANRWIFSSNNAETSFFYAKLPMLTLGVVLAIFVFCWARELYGYVAAFAALAMYVFDPNILAHSPLIHTDIPFALTFFAGTYYFWRTLREITWFNLLMTAALFSLSVITKFSSLAILPIWGILSVYRIFSSVPLRSRITAYPLIFSRRAKAAWLTVMLTSAILTAFFTLWAAYGFRYEAVSDRQAALPVGYSAVLSPWLTSIFHFNTTYHMFPEAWMSGIGYAYSSAERSAYLLGEISDEGFWLYFPIAFAVKTPLATLVLLLVALFVTLFERERRADAIYLLLPAILFFSMAVYSRMNIGLRHILVIYPFLFVWLGGAVGTLWESGSRTKKCAILFLGIWLLGSSLKSYPDYLAFFNETVSDLRNRHEILVDSNLDWGQDLKGLKRWMDEHGVGKIELAYFGTADPSYYGINAVHRPGSLTVFFSRPRESDNRPVSPFIAISATHLVGVYLRPRNPYREYLLKEPVATIGHSILIYRTDQ